MASHEWYHDIYRSNNPYFANGEHSVIRRAPITVLVPPQPSPPPPPLIEKLDPDREITRLESTASSEEYVPGKRRKYTLKKDSERSDPEYKDMRKKNNESVRKTREKKRLEEELEKTKNHEEKIALREIVKVVMMTRESEHLREINLLKRLEPPNKIIELSGRLSELQRKLCEEIRKETPALGDYRLQMLV
ncbi:hypothetical protein PRIPAC_88427 [Pristionchus pacificus]|nr:hypothetical protein PRIPAC_88427 [Pristionchus pacificus]|eukprot:PDM61704.1 hypothetical protein PRIPAC_51146 [Pristionchus pacificus]